MNKNVKNTSIQKLSQHFLSLAAFVIIGVPLILALLYNWLAGGVLNGLAGSWHRATINPDVFILLVNPVVMISGYALLCCAYRDYTLKNKSQKGKVVFATVVLIFATFVTFMVTFWKWFTT